MVPPQLSRWPLGGHSLDQIMRQLVVLAISCFVISGQVEAQTSPCPGSRFRPQQEASWPQIFKTCRPIALLDTLKARQKPFSIWPIRDWIREADIPKLLPLLDSTDSCANVSTVFSSYYDQNKSTVAREAAFLIMGFRCNVYPPMLNSRSLVWPKDSILQWWKRYEATRNSTGR